MKDVRWLGLLGLALALPLFLGACGGDGGPDGPDGGDVDGGDVDGGIDAGGDDAGTIDAGGDDAGTIDAGGDDAGATDAGGDDAGATDAGGDGAVAPVADVVINEFVFNHRGEDAYEYVELYGDPSTDLTGVSVLVLEGDIDSVSASPGVIEDVIPAGSTDGDGFWSSGFLDPDTLENGTQTALLVQGFSGAALDDLDPDDDGTLDSMPWDLLLDAVAVDDGGDGDFTYAGGAVLTPGFDGLGEIVGGASRLPDGADTDAAGDDWARNDFDGQGIVDLEPGTPIDDEALNTPGAANARASTPPTDAIINEFVASHATGDSNEFVEILGSADTDYSSLAVIAVEGDATGDGSPLGRIDAVVPVGTTDADGYWVSDFLSNELENGTQTLLLVQFLEVSAGFDVDTDDDGTMDETPWYQLLDAVAVDDGDDGDMTYGEPVLAPDFDGGTEPVGGASRIPDGTDTDAASDWTRNDFDGDGLPDVGGGPATADEAVNTPGTENQIGGA